MRFDTAGDVALIGTDVSMNLRAFPEGGATAPVSLAAGTYFLGVVEGDPNIRVSTSANVHTPGAHWAFLFDNWNTTDDFESDTPCAWATQVPPDPSCVPPR